MLLHRWQTWLWPWQVECCNIHDSLQQLWVTVDGLASTSTHHLGPAQTPQDLDAYDSKHIGSQGVLGGDGRRSKVSSAGSVLPRPTHLPLQSSTAVAHSGWLCIHLNLPSWPRSSTSNLNACPKEHQFPRITGWGMAGGWRSKMCLVSGEMPDTIKSVTDVGHSGWPCIHINSTI